ncbi:transmembrane 9 superfamily member 4-like [Ramicandelaber brevisporus]|nr:transmembrane 9 superfamily member 4-like [Ramicandelaber brevisporus]
MRRAAEVVGVIAAAIATLGSHQAAAMYVPSFGINEFRKGDQINVMANKAFSERAPLPFALESLSALCPPTNTRHSWLNLGEILRGDRIFLSDYKLEFGKPDTCKVLCTRTVTFDAASQLGQLIRADYRAEYIIDNLPGATVYGSNDFAGASDVDGEKRRYQSGFPLGETDQGAHDVFVNNHLEFVVRYQRISGEKPSKSVAGQEEIDPNARHHIVGFEVRPRSIQNSGHNCPKDIQRDDLPRQPILKALAPKDTTVDITYSYSVQYVEDTQVTWHNRWNRYLGVGSNDTSIHWYAVGNSLLIALMLTAIVALILLRALNYDLANYNAIGDEEDLRNDLEETTGWKLLHGDVFRAPRRGGLLAPFLGTGVQVVGMGLAIISLAVLGLLSPASRGALLTASVVVFALFGVLAGYWSARMYKTWNGTHWLRNAVVTASLAPLVTGVVVFPINIFVWARGSSSAIPFGTLLTLGGLCLAVMLPLTVLGAFIGNRRPVFEPPLRVSSIPRPIPPRRWYLRPIPSMIVAGALPFSVMFIELFFILNSVWQDQFYYMYGFLALVAAILLITVAETTIVMIYLQLCSEDHEWWWSAFRMASGGCIYIFVYAIQFYVLKLRSAHFAGSLMFFGYTLLACAAYALGTGAIGFATTYLFVRRIYSAVKLD